MDHLTVGRHIKNALESYLYGKSGKNKINLLKTLMVLLVLLSSAQAYAYDIEVGGIYYSITSEEELTVAVVSGNDSYNGNIEIPDKILYDGKYYNVTSIGDGAFSWSSGLTSVTIPNSVTSIGDGAFSRCSGLTSVTIPNSVTSIGDAAFYNCMGLTSVTIPNSVTSISDSAFYNCMGLTSVTIPNSVTSIGDAAFYYCSGLTSVTIPNSVTSIGDYAFAGCSGLTSVTIPNSVTSIGDCAFAGCSSLKEFEVDGDNPVFASQDGVLYNKDLNILYIFPCGREGDYTIPNSVTSIGDDAFSYCSSLTSVTIPNSVISIGNGAFTMCIGLTSVTIPNSVTSIGDDAFTWCRGLTSVTIPNSVTSIGDGAFMYCSGLTSVTIPNSVTSIGDYAFASCSGLTSVTIPNSVTSIGDNIFYGCNALCKIYCYWKEPVAYNEDGIDEIGSQCVLYVPKGCIDAYSQVDPWRYFNHIEEFDDSGITDMTTDGFEFSVNDGVINIHNVGNDVLIEVLDLGGKAVYRNYGNTIVGLGKGIYLVRIGSAVKKIRI